jgi:hypothetical protein
VSIRTVKNNAKVAWKVSTVEQRRRCSRENHFGEDVISLPFNRLTHVQQEKWRESYRLSREDD